jgi:hypothetical protein
MLTLAEARRTLIDLEASIGPEGKVHPRDAALAQILLAILDGEIVLGPVDAVAVDAAANPGQLAVEEHGPAGYEAHTVYFDTPRDAELASHLVAAARGAPLSLTTRTVHTRGDVTYDRCASDAANERHAIVHGDPQHADAAQGGIITDEHGQHYANVPVIEETDYPKE